MSNVIGYVGLGFLGGAWIFNYFKKMRMFYFINILASFLLTAHAINLGDVPFTFVNSLVGLISILKFYNEVGNG